MRPFKYFMILAFVVFTTSLLAQDGSPAIMQKVWNAIWIVVPGESSQEYGVYRFKKSVQLTTKPSRFIIHVSADNRYKLFVNGQLVSLGPARGDIYHWNFETVNIAPYLRAGENNVSALVWNEGEFRAEAQMSNKTAFILQGDSPAEEVLNTNNSWQGIRDNSFTPVTPNLIHTYYVAGPGDMVDFRKSVTTSKDSDWKKAQELNKGLPKGVFGWTDGWMLVPSPIPQMELTTQRLKSMRKAEGVKVPATFPAQKTAFTIPANTVATILVDQSHLTNAYPTILFSKGKDAQITLAYTEALYIKEADESKWKEQNKKGNRNEVEGKRFVGREDVVISNGTANQEYTSLSWRTYRYVQLKLETKNEPLVIDDFYGTFTGYPFKNNSKFISENPLLSDILQTGWRTARLCAVETYMDCPFYEQLQYVGDTRIQALVSLFNSGDDRLMRNAINSIDNSRLAEGVTLSRYPTAHAQEIPTFSLWWIGMLNDYWRYRPDADFIKEKLAGERQVLNFFSRYQQEDGSLKNTPYWNFTDWAEDKGWKQGMAPIGENGNSASLDLQLLWAYQIAAELESKIGMAAYAEEYKIRAQKLMQTIRTKYWNESKLLFADTPEKDLYSQHVNALAILTETVTGDNANQLAKKVLTDTSLTQATIYFKYYINQALFKTGLGNDYLNWLGIWKDNLAHGMTTWGETSDINGTRSDCHAWGSHPNIEFFRTVLGIDSDAPGFSAVKIEPHLGDLKKVSGEMPHPNGKVSAQYVLNNGKLKAVIGLPKNTPGYLLWKGQRYPLKAGETTTLSL